MNHSRELRRLSPDHGCTAHRQKQAWKPEITGEENQRPHGRPIVGSDPLPRRSNASPALGRVTGTMRYARSRERNRKGAPAPRPEHIHFETWYVDVYSSREKCRQLVTGGCVYRASGVYSGSEREASHRVTLSPPDLINPNRGMFISRPFGSDIARGLFGGGATDRSEVSPRLLVLKGRVGGCERVAPWLCLGDPDHARRTSS